MTSIVKTVSQQITDAVARAFAAAIDAGTLPNAPIPAFTVEVPADRTHGDFAVNAAMVGARAFRLPPRKIADALLSHLQAAYPGYQADFVYSPRSRLLHTALAARHAAFNPEQQKMVLRSPHPYVPDSRVQLYTPAFRAQYLALHDDDRYWTGERVLAAQDTFRVLLAIEDGAVAGYLDLTYRNAENEPYDLFVREKSRRRGLGRALLSCAIEKNRPNAMSLLVDSDNLAARRLYASLGFVEKPEENNITAHLKL